MQPLKSNRPDPSSLPDEDLIRYARQGEAAAFGAITQRYNRRLYRVARGITRDDWEADDVLQEAYLRAYGALPGFRGEASLATWLTRIVLNEALGRARRRRPTEGLAALDAVQAGDTRVLAFPGGAAMADPEVAAARAEIRRLLERAVDDLPDTFRPVFVMREIEGMSVEETAAHLGIRAETVKTRLHRARGLLRKALDAKLATALHDAFPFAGPRCQRITEAVVGRIEREALSPAPGREGRDAQNRK